MIKIKFNHFFFIFAILLPLAMGTLGTIIYWPAIHSHYWEVLMSPTMNIIGGYIVVFVFDWIIVAYMALPWLVVIKNDRIVFHRLFRRKLVIEYSSIKELEVMGNALSIEDNRWALGNLLFYMKNGTRIFVVAVPYYALIELKRMLKRYGVEPVVTHRKPTEKEREEIKRKVIKV